MSQTPPQPERDAETVALYVEESIEALQQVEQLLLDAERGAPAADMMGRLFRAVHTIKGTAGYLAYGHTQKLAHAAEDLLSRLRDGKLIARPEHFSALVAVNDLLRQLINNVRQTQDEGTVEVDGLVTQLRAAAAEVQGAAPSTPAPTPVAAVAPAVPVPVAPVGAAPPPAVESVSSAPAQSPVAASPAAPEPERPVPPVVAAPASAPVAVAVPEEAAPKAQAAEPSHPPATDGAAQPQAKTEAADSTVRVNVQVLDRLMNLIGELVLARNQMVQMVKVAFDSNASTQSVLARLNNVTSELQEQVMKTRMQPIARVFEKIPRIVRDVARATDKQVVTEIEGNATEIDKALVEAIRDPVMHIVRNAIDHGIESPSARLAAGKPEVGTVSVRAAHKGGAVTIEVQDDGKGMEPKFIRAHAIKKGILSLADANKLTDREAIDLVFRPGFSTAAAVTDISGRGVGMDVVRTHVERAGGQAEIESTPGKGTIIRLKMPLTLAIIPALLVRAQNQRFAIPQVNLLELVYLTPEQTKQSIEQVRGATIHRLRGEILPVVSLNEVLGLSEQGVTVPHSDQGTHIIVLAVGARRYSLLVDGIDNTEEIVIKPLSGLLKRLTCYSGATVLGDGGVALILDVAGIAARAGLSFAETNRDSVKDAASIGGTESMLVFALGEAQCAVPLAMVARLEQVQKSQIETVGGTEVLQYRGQMLTIVHPEPVLGLYPQPSERTEQLLLVFDFGQLTALAVDRIIDIVEVPKSAPRLIQAGTEMAEKLVIGQKATLLLDVYRIMAAMAPQFTQAHKPEHAFFGAVYCVQSSQALRTALCHDLQRAGIPAKPTDSVNQALQMMRSEPRNGVSALVVDGEAQSGELNQLIDRMNKEWPELPVYVWGADAAEADSTRATSAGGQRWFGRLARDELVHELKTVSERQEQSRRQR